MIKKLFLTFFSLSVNYSLYSMGPDQVLDGETIIEYNNLDLSENMELIELPTKFSIFFISSSLDEKVYSCNICKESYNNMPALISHSTIHKEKIPANISPFRNSSVKKYKSS